MEDLAQLRAAPEYTMQAVSQQTGVPPETLRSWERRHGFPVPGRTDSNRRLYSERDLAAIHWLKDQTEQGQGISEAVAMLRSRLSGDEPPAPSNIRRLDAPGAAPYLEQLVDALLRNRFDLWQQAWDHVALSVSAEGLCGGVLLPAYREMQGAYAAGRLGRSSFLRAEAFLGRKATVLLDHAGPDRGEPSVCLATAGNGDLPALILATMLANAGCRIATPFLPMTSIDAVTMIQHVQSAVVIVVLVPDVDVAQVASFASMLPDQSIAVWSLAGPVGLDDLRPNIIELPPSLQDAIDVIRSTGTSPIARRTPTGHTLSTG
jgi:DNA-binding transcriptional MerR regulator